MCIRDRPHTKQLLVVFPRPQFDKEKGASVYIARGAQWWTPGSAPNLKLANHSTSPKSIEQGIEVAEAYATNCDDVERMILWKEPGPTPPPAPPPRAPPPPQNGPTAPGVCVSDANTGQLGHESRLKLMAIIAVAKSRGLFPPTPRSSMRCPAVRCPSHWWTRV